MVFTHVSVMAREVVDFLRPEPRRRYLDGTLGGGGHTEQILIQSSPDGQVLGLDLDDEALVAAARRLIAFGDRLMVRQANFAAAGAILSEIGWSQVDGVVLDLGVSYHQLESRERGFSFRSVERRGGRCGRRQALDAYHIVNGFTVSELERILCKYGEEHQESRFALDFVAGR